MARKTDGEKIDDLISQMQTVNERVDNLARDIVKHDANDEKLQDLMSALTVQVALIKQNVEEMKKSQDESGKKRWSLLPPVLGALISSLLAAAIAYFIAKR